MTAVPIDPAAAEACPPVAVSLVHARRPFTPAVLRAKLQTQGESWADVVFFVDVRAVIDRLNLLFPGRWHADLNVVEHSPPPEPGADAVLVYRCRLTAAELVHTDVGEGFDHKAARSDALKRAAIHLGIGHCLWRIAPIRMIAGPRRHELRGDPCAFELDNANRRWLRGRYQAWLTRAGIAEFGLPLDHGQAAGAIAPELFPDAPRTPRRVSPTRARDLAPTPAPPASAHAARVAIASVLTAAPPAGSTAQDAKRFVTPLAAVSAARPAPSPADDRPRPAAGAESSPADGPSRPAVGAESSLADDPPRPPVGSEPSPAHDASRPAVGSESSSTAGPPRPSAGSEPPSTDDRPRRGLSAEPPSATAPPTPRALQAVPAPAEPSATTRPPLAVVPVAAQAPSAPASPEQRAALVDIARRLGYGILTVEALAACIHGVTFKELDEARLQAVRSYLDSAAGGRVADRDLAARIAQGLREATASEPARDRLARWLLACEERAAAELA